ncbi:hypothetical protein DFH09DRAFT_1076369 [Mycena vulgaris]|nr:hypothetical protein DFH09DRAFT_1102935 [Mycena vulgaris]KAJ6582503.1 hypothetical protein DFH09DRAFT_1076369 [Mycena vulgaris]
MAGPSFLGVLALSVCHFFTSPTTLLSSTILMNAATTSPTPTQELAALVAKVAALSKLALEMTKLTMDIDGMARLTSSFLTHFILDAIPNVIASQVAEAVAAIQRKSIQLPLDPISPSLPASAPQFVEGVASTPDQMEAMFPPGFGDHQACNHHRLSVGADAEVNGVPGQFRQKKASRIEALAFYRNRYNDNAVIKLNEVVVAAPAPTPAVAAPTAAPPAPTQ